MSTDTILIDRLSLPCPIGLDCWGRARSQPVVISIYLYLVPGYLTRVGQSDNIDHTVDYSQLTKIVSGYVQEGERFRSVGELMDGVAAKGFEVGGESVDKVKVLVELPKMVQLAQGGVVVESVVGREESEEKRRRVYVKDLVFGIVIGVNEAERKEKQRVVVNIEVDEIEEGVDYNALVRVLDQEISQTAYLTLEKLVGEVIRISCSHLSPKQASSLTVRAQKPSALSFAQSSGVEMTRRIRGDPGE